MTVETGAAQPDAEQDATGVAGEASVAGESSAAHAAAEDPSSRDEVDVGDAAAVERWAQALGVPAEALEGAVKAVGPRVDRIKDYLTGGIAGDQEDA